MIAAFNTKAPDLILEASQLVTGSKQFKLDSFAIGEHLIVAWPYHPTEPMEPEYTSPEVLAQLLKLGKKVTITANGNASITIEKLFLLTTR